MSELLRRLHQLYGQDGEGENENGSCNGVGERKTVDKPMTQVEFDELREETWALKAALNRAASKNDKKNNKE